MKTNKFSLVLSILALVLSAGAFIMATNSQLLGRFLRDPNTPLPEYEVQQLERAMDDLDQTKSFTDSLQNGSGNPRINELWARRTDLETPPGNPYIVYWYDADPGNWFIVPNTTWTPLDLTDARLTIKTDNPCIVRMEGTKIYAAQGAYLNIYGHIQWDASGAFLREIDVANYTSAGVLIDRRALTIGGPTIITFSGMRPANSVISTDLNQYFQLEVLQNSGDALGIVSINLTITLSYR